MDGAGSGARSGARGGVEPRRLHRHVPPAADLRSRHTVPGRSSSASCASNSINRLKIDWEAFRADVLAAADGAPGECGTPIPRSAWLFSLAWRRAQLRFVTPTGRWIAPNRCVSSRRRAPRCPTRSGTSKCRRSAGAPPRRPTSRIVSNGHRGLRSRWADRLDRGPQGQHRREHVARDRRCRPRVGRGWSATSSTPPAPRSRGRITTGRRGTIRPWRSG